MSYVNGFKPLKSAADRPDRHPIAYFTAAFITVAVFGPYTSLPGVRTEQVAVYGSLLVGTVFCLWLRLRMTRGGALVLALLVTELLVAVLRALYPLIDLGWFSPGSAGAGLDNFLLPIACLLIGAMLVGSGADPTRLVRIVCTVLVVAMCLNAALAFVSSVYDLTWLLGRFWDKGDPQLTVAAKAAQMGRYSGVINQPFEAGALYGMSVLAATYLYRENALKLGTITLFLTLGGVLTVSKVFLLVGFPIAVWQMIRVSGARTLRLTVLVGLAVLATVAAESGLLLSSASSDYLGLLLHPSGGANGVMALYTAGRFGGASALQPVTSAVLESSPWFGFGIRGLAAPYDNAWVEALVVAGIVGAVLYTAVLVTLGVIWARRRTHVDQAQSSFAGGLVLLVIGASVGMPALTANRVATIAWLLIAFLLLSPTPKPVEPTVAASRRGLPGGVAADRRVAALAPAGALPLWSRPAAGSGPRARRGPAAAGSSVRVFVDKRSSDRDEHSVL
ncbi:hypothetical protein [Planosporangium mesophilum]|uniref:O-antigen ligase domain-containing protein n=1 Tax=Planosporangium mesophilum TaxID=689768 RepID=A0A8J3TAD4_9ACTN|nr:hypothetical protein [Planosporangium mesophilum]NJC81140.1 hypothetical protein [Planosporangium mesophilum]GII21209.1 hypothetical protein Pme01_08060 [Planosporangium mesophilum]